MSFFHCNIVKQKKQLNSKFLFVIGRTDFVHYFKFDSWTINYSSRLYTWRLPIKFVKINFSILYDFSSMAECLDKQKAWKTGCTNVHASQIVCKMHNEMQNLLTVAEKINFVPINFVWTTKMN